MATFLGIALVVLIVAALLALDRWAGGRQGRTLARARDGQVGDARVDYPVMERQNESTQHQT
jgi:type II secretory pathway pseudopilin PulG